MNEMRGLLAEYGIVVTRGIAPWRRILLAILEDPENGLSGLFRDMLAEMAERLRALDEHIRQYDRVARVFRQDERGGPLLTATALVAAVGNAHEFKSSRELSAWRSHSKADLVTICQRLSERAI